MEERNILSDKSQSLRLIHSDSRQNFLRKFWKETGILSGDARYPRVVVLKAGSRPACRFTSIPDYWNPLAAGSKLSRQVGSGCGRFLLTQKHRSSLRFQTKATQVAFFLAYFL